MFLSLNPSYRCNFRCDSCYLTEDQLRSKQRLDLGLLDRRLGELQDHYELEQIDLYGGEITVLPLDYLEQLWVILRKHFQGRVNLISNFSLLHPMYMWEDDSRLTLSASYDFSARQQHDSVLTNILLTPRPVHVLMLATPALLNIDVLAMVETFNSIRNVASVEIKPYSKSQANDLPISYRDYERFVQQWIEAPRNFPLINEQQIQDSLNGERNAFSDDHIYLTPAGDWAVLDFDMQDREYFRTLNSLADYPRWCGLEKVRTYRNAICASCPYLGHCLSEHLREVHDLNDSCNGFRNLLDWYSHNVQNS